MFRIHSFHAQAIIYGYWFIMAVGSCNPYPAITPIPKDSVIKGRCLHHEMGCMQAAQWYGPLAVQTAVIAWPKFLPCCHLQGFLADPSY